MKQRENNSNQSKSELLEIINSLQSNLADSKKNIVFKDKLVTHQKEQIELQQGTIEYLKEQIKLNRYLRFASTSEKYANGMIQASLFDEPQLPDNLSDIKANDEQQAVASYTRASKPGRKPLPKELQRVQKTYDITDEQKQCACGCQLTHIGDVRSEQLEIVPAKLFVIEHIKLKYACKGCEQTICEAKAPAQPIPKSIAGPGLLAHVITSKYIDHLPLYRQEKILKRAGIDILRSTMSHWVIKCATLFEPLVKLMQDKIITYDVAYADESRLQVLIEKDRSPQSKSYIWVFGGGAPDKFNLVYRYNISRGHQVAEQFFEDFSGYLHCDGYSGYDAYSAKHRIKQVGCWYHSRRKFVEAQKVSAKKGLATTALEFIRKLSHIERKAESLDEKSTFELRQTEAVPILKEFNSWLIVVQPTTPPKSLLGAAISYTLNQWSKLMRYVDDGRLEISNNRTERAIKPFATGRKNWLFSNSVGGAKASATLYSIVQTCVHHNIEPYAYLAHALTELPGCQTLEELEKMLPYNVEQKILIKYFPKTES